MYIYYLFHVLHNFVFFQGLKLHYYIFRSVATLAIRFLSLSHSFQFKIFFVGVLVNFVGAPFS